MGRVYGMGEGRLVRRVFETKERERRRSTITGYTEEEVEGEMIE